MSTREMWYSRSGERGPGTNARCRVPHKEKRMPEPEISWQVKGRMDRIGVADTVRY